MDVVPSTAGIGHALCFPCAFQTRVTALGFERRTLDSSAVISTGRQMWSETEKDRRVSFQTSGSPLSWPAALLKGARPTSICHLIGWYMDGITVAENVHQLRLKPGDSEKITINLGYVDLGHIDLMVQEGFYSNRTDFIRTAIRNQLERHADVVKQSTARKHLDLGLRHYSREDLETARSEGEMLHIRVLGLASIGPDVTPELARATVASVVVLGALHASPAVKAALADRMR